MMLPLGTGRKQQQFSYVLHADATWHTCKIAEFCGKPHGGAKRHHIFFVNVTQFLIKLRSQVRH